MASSPTDAAAHSGKIAQRREAESSPSEAEMLAAEAEAQAAKAEAEAAEASARAIALRAELAAAASAEAPADPDGVADSDSADDEQDAAEREADDSAEPEVVTGERWIRAPRGKTVVAAATVLLICALAAVSGCILWQSHRSSQHRAHEAEFTAAAQQGVINLTSLNFNQGDQDIQRLIDSTTGEFRADFEKSKNDFLTVMKDSKVVTQASAKAAGIESMNGDSAVVLVAATSQVSNMASRTPTPRAWRLAVTIERDNGQLKMSKVEFVP